MLAPESWKRNGTTRKWPTYGGYTMLSFEEERKANLSAGKNSEVLLGHAFVGSALTFLPTDGGLNGYQKKKYVCKVHMSQLYPERIY